MLRASARSPAANDRGTGAPAALPGVLDPALPPLPLIMQSALICAHVIKINADCMISARSEEVGTMGPVTSGLPAAARRRGPRVRRLRPVVRRPGDRGRRRGAPPQRLPGRYGPPCRPSPPSCAGSGPCPTSGPSVEDTSATSGTFLRVRRFQLHRTRADRGRTGRDPMFGDLRAVRFRYADADATSTRCSTSWARASPGSGTRSRDPGPTEWTLRTVRRLPGEIRPATWLVRQATHEARHHVRDIATSPSGWERRR